MTNYGVVIVACSPGYRSSSIVVCYFVSTVNLYCNFYGYKKNDKFTLCQIYMCVYAYVRVCMRAYTCEHECGCGYILFNGKVLLK